MQSPRTSVDLVHPLTVIPSAEEQHVRARGRPDERDLTEVGARASIRAAGHTHDNGIIAQTVLLANLLNLVDENGEVLGCVISMSIDRDVYDISLPAPTQPWLVYTSGTLRRRTRTDVSRCG